MAFPFSYTKFQQDPNPVQPVYPEEYVAMKRDLNHFMHVMLKRLYTDEGTVGKERTFNPWQMLGFAASTLGMVAAVIFFSNPVWVGLAGFTGIVLFVATLAVPITHFQDKFLFKKHRSRFMQEVKSYYLFQYSILRQTNSFEEYEAEARLADPKGYEPYYRKYALS